MFSTSRLAGSKKIKSRNASFSEPVGASGTRWPNLDGSICKICKSRDGPHQQQSSRSYALKIDQLPEFATVLLWPSTWCVHEEKWNEKKDVCRKVKREMFLSLESQASIFTKYQAWEGHGESVLLLLWKYCWGHILLHCSICSSKNRSDASVDWTVRTHII